MPHPQPIDLGRIVPDWTPQAYDELVSTLLDNAEFLAFLTRLAANATTAEFNARTDTVPTSGSQNFVTSNGIYQAIFGRKVYPSVTLSGPATLNTTDILNTRLFYDNGGDAANTLSITLPSNAAHGDTFFLEFRSTGSEDVPAVITAFEAEDGCELLQKGEIDPNARCTRIEATFASGVWLANITTFDIISGVMETLYGTIIYSGANYAALAGKVVDVQAPVGPNTVMDGNTMAEFASLYGMAFEKWNTAQDGSGTDYPIGSVADIESEGQTITLYPVYTQRTITKSIALDAVSGKTVTRSQTIAATSILAGFSELCVDIKVSATISGGTLTIDDGNGRSEVRQDAPSRSSTGDLTVRLTRASASDSFKLLYKMAANNGKIKPITISAFIIK